MSTLEPGVRVHIVGIGGAGMSGLARLLSEMGCVVSGSDALESSTTDELRVAGVEVHAGHRADNVGTADLVLWSPAVAPDNVEFLAARERGLTMMDRAQALATLGERQRVIGFTGTHGKTTATSMMVHVLRAAGRDDSRLVGAPVIGVGANGHWGLGDLVMEVDESYGTFSLLSPFALGLLNIEPDHLDHYGTPAALEEAFSALVARTSGPVVAWVDDEGVRRSVAATSREVVSVASKREARWRVRDSQLARRSASFELVGPVGQLTVALAVTGAHNIANAAVAAVVALELGVGPDAVVQGLGRFRGAPRRFEYLGRWRDADVYEDYAHLPGEITATLAGARAAGYQRITAVFQPHRVTRTERLAPSFARAFDDAQYVVVTDIYSAGESNPRGVTGALIADAVGPRCVYAASFEDVLGALNLIEDSDAVLLLGAGDVGTLAHRLPGGLG
ncbi:MAG TPA: UDP-N-acetylmuramate--L-alanine ligase [Acidimicrobiales bacterium]|nr:UDP-N-acetylmuramate--L-alanine ligase [Acidimicrobiales bacterium]